MNSWYSFVRYVTDRWMIGIVVIGMFLLGIRSSSLIVVSHAFATIPGGGFSSYKYRTFLPYNRSRYRLVTTPTKMSQDDSEIIDSFVDYEVVIDNHGRYAYEKCVDTSIINDNDESKNTTSTKIASLIRIEKDIDPILVQECTTQQSIIEKIVSVRKQQNLYGNAQLYTRHWVQRQDVMSTGSNSTNSEQSNTPTTTDTSTVPNTTKNTFTIAQFNTLAEGLAVGPDDNIPPFNVTTKTKSKLCRVNETNDANNNDNNNNNEKNRYGGFSSLSNPEIILNYKLRKWRILETILGGGIITNSTTAGSKNTNTTNELDPCYFDIIALQEIDRYYSFYEPILQQHFGYDGLFVPKLYSPGIRYGYYSDGCCLFWQRNVFHKIHSISYNYTATSTNTNNKNNNNNNNNLNQVALLVTLQHIKSQRMILVATTHLKSQNTIENEVVRKSQIEQLLRYISIEQHRIQEMYGLTTADIPCFIVGDMNSDPPIHNKFFPISCIQSILLDHRGNQISSTTTTTQSQGVAEETADKSATSTASEIITRTETTLCQWQSAYDIIVQPFNEFYTTWKIRGSVTYQRIIDYIFYKGTNIRCTAILQVPNNDEIETTKLPGLRYPSDHILLAAQFEIT